MKTTTTDVLPLLGLNGIDLLSGGHSSREAGVCAMEAVAWLAGEHHSDRPKCACPVVGVLVRSLNDRLPDADRNQLLKPILPQLIGSKASPEVERRRAFLAADWAVRTLLDRVCERRGYTTERKAIASLAPLTDRTTALAGLDAANTIRSHAAATYATYAAYAAAAAAATYAATAAAATYAATAAAATYAAATAAAATYAATAAAAEREWIYDQLLQLINRMLAVRDEA